MVKTNKWGEPVEPRNDIVHLHTKVKAHGVFGPWYLDKAGCGIGLYDWHNTSKDPAKVTCKRCLRSKAFKNAVNNMRTNWINRIKGNLEQIENLGQTTDKVGNPSSYHLVKTLELCDETHIFVDDLKESIRAVIRLENDRCRANLNKKGE